MSYVWYRVLLLRRNFMTQLDYIILALKNLGGKASYSEIYEEY